MARPRINKKSEVAEVFGRQGGLATSKKHGKEHYKHMAELSHVARRQKKIDKQTTPEFKLE